ncbi:MAG: efflux RND transporter periplasmic adaptor subunit [Synergistaceae bacterium]|jgi:HlyD family secretion protein|nr:efflux RND transporter periplasmic adaptor subunit [Synergistaceae bacterium]
MKKSAKFLITAAVLCSIAYGGYLWIRPARASYSYRTQPVTRGSITSGITATGKVNAVEMVEIGTQVSGTIEEIHVDFNSPVKKGQLLAVLDPDVLASRVKESQASLALARAGVSKARAEVENSTRTHNRNRELWDRKLIARSDLDSSETSLALAKASMIEAGARAVQAEESLRQAEMNLRYAKIFSPIDGVVVSRKVDVGQTVAASLQTPTLFSIARDLTHMQVEANIDEADIGRITEGQKAICKFDSWPQDSFEAVVSQKRLSPETVSNVVTYVVILKIDNVEKKLMPGMTANISIIIEERADVLKIPAAALRFAPPADEIDAREKKKDETSSEQGGLFMMPRRPGANNDSRGSEQAVWLVENGNLAGKVILDETGVNDRTWVELRGDAQNVLKEGQELAVAFTKDSDSSLSSAAAASTKK